MDSMISIGTPAESVDAVGQAIVNILKSPGDQVTIQSALEALTNSVKVEGVTVSGCHLSGGESSSIDHEDLATLLKRLV